MESDKEVGKSAGHQLVKRSAWLGTKISFAVLAPICVLVWAGLLALPLYKCVTSGISPVALLRAMDSMSSTPDGATHLTKYLNAFIAAPTLVAVGVGSSAVTGH